MQLASLVDIDPDLPSLFATLPRTARITTQRKLHTLNLTTCWLPKHQPMPLSQAPKGRGTLAGILLVPSEPCQTISLFSPTPMGNGVAPNMSWLLSSFQRSTADLRSHLQQQAVHLLTISVSWIFLSKARHLCSHSQAHTCTHIHTIHKTHTDANTLHAFTHTIHHTHRTQRNTTHKHRYRQTYSLRPSCL